jgi:hypothetical protein
VTTWDPWGNLPNLRKEAPSRTKKQDDEPMPQQVTQGLKLIGIDPTSAGAIIAEIFKRGWQFLLAGGPPMQVHAAIFEPRYGAVRATKAPARCRLRRLAVCLLSVSAVRRGTMRVAI